MSNSTTSGAPPAPSAWCCWSRSARSSLPSVASFRSIACWGKNDDVAPIPHCSGRDLRAGAALSHPADPDHRADVVLGCALLEFSAAVAVAALVSGIYRQFGLDAGNPRDADG